MAEWTIIPAEDILNRFAQYYPGKSFKAGYDENNRLFIVLNELELDAHLTLAGENVSLENIPQLIQMLQQESGAAEAMLVYLWVDEIPQPAMPSVPEQEVTQESVIEDQGNAPAEDVMTALEENVSSDSSENEVPAVAEDSVNAVPEPSQEENPVADGLGGDDLGGLNIPDISAEDPNISPNEIPAGNPDEELGVDSGDTATEEVSLPIEETRVETSGNEDVSSEQPETKFEITPPQEDADGGDIDNTEPNDIPADVGMFRLQQEKEHLLRETEELRKEAEAEKAEVNSLIEEVNALTQKQDDMNAAAEKAQNDIVQLQTALDQAKQESEQSKAEFEQSKTELQAALGQIEQLKAEQEKGSPEVEMLDVLLKDLFLLCGGNEADLPQELSVRAEYTAAYIKWKIETCAQ